MRDYLVSYDLHLSGQDYSSLIKEIKSYHDAVPVLKSVWFIRSSQSAKEIRTNLAQYLDDNDEMIVIEMEHNRSVVLDDKTLKKIKWIYV